MENNEIMNNEVVENAMEAVNETTDVPTNSNAMTKLVAGAAIVGVVAVAYAGIKYGIKFGKKAVKWVTSKLGKKEKVEAESVEKTDVQDEVDSE